MWFIKCVYSVGIFYKLNVWFEINYNERLELKKKEYDSVQKYPNESMYALKGMDI